MFNSVSDMESLFLARRALIRELERARADTAIAETTGRGIVTARHAERKTVDKLNANSGAIEALRIAFLKADPGLRHAVEHGSPQLAAQAMTDSELAQMARAGDDARRCAAMREQDQRADARVDSDRMAQFMATADQY